MKLKKAIAFFALVLLPASPPAFAAQTTNAPAPAVTNAPVWLTQPLSIAEALNIALRQNSAILRSSSDIEAAYGIAIQTRAIAIPKIRSGASYNYNKAIERFFFALPAGFATGPLAPGINPGESSWDGNIRVIQSIYEGGRIKSALRTARLTREQALFQHDVVVADTIFAVRQAYYDVVLAEQQIKVQEASLKLLEEQLKTATSKAEAGVTTQFEVLRAQVEVANAKPRLIGAQNSYRIAKNNLANLLGFNVPRSISEDIPMQLTDQPQAEPYQVDLPAAIGRALKSRPELGALRKAEGLRREDVITAKAGYKPKLEVFGGYTARSPQLQDNFFHDISGWTAGVQMNWDIFDGFLTKGRVKEAEARLQGAKIDLDDISRKIELEVRTAYSQFIEAKQTLQAQEKVGEQALEAVRLATARWEAGAEHGTQLDVLNAQTSLTEARTTQAQALHDYAVAYARLERAMGTAFEKPPQK